MAVVSLGYPSAAAASGGGATSDPIAANAATLTIGDWEDVEDFNGLVGQAFLAMSQAGDALTFQPTAGTHYSGARWQDAIPAGDFLIAADIFIARTEDASFRPGIEGLIGVSPGGLEAVSPSWYGAGIDGKSNTAATIVPRGWYRESSGLWAGVGFSAVTAVGGYAYRFAIERVGTTITIWYVGPQDNLIQLGSRTNAAVAGECDLFIRTQGSSDSGNSRYVTLKALALDGLAISGNRLVSAE